MSWKTHCRRWTLPKKCLTLEPSTPVSKFLCASLPITRNFWNTDRNCFKGSHKAKIRAQCCQTRKWHLKSLKQSRTKKVIRSKREWKVQAKAISRWPEQATRATKNHLLLGSVYFKSQNLAILFVSPTCWTSSTKSLQRPLFRCVKSIKCTKLWFRFCRSTATVTSDLTKMQLEKGHSKLL